MHFILSLQLAAIALNFGVLVSAVYEGIYARRGGDPTKIRVVTDPRGGTINNPGYREYHQPTNGKGETDSRLISQNSTRSPACMCVWVLDALYMTLISGAEARQAINGINDVNAN